MESGRQFTLGSAINLITLVVGLTAGFVLGTNSRGEVHAQAVKSSAPKYEDVTPGMVIGSLGSNLVLAHEVDADKVVVNGIDLLQFDQNMLVYLSRLPNAENADLENLINASRATVLHRIAEPKLTGPVSPSIPVKK